MVTDVPPVLEPDIGDTEDTVGAVSYTNWSPEFVIDVPEGVVTVTSTVPALSAGAVAVMEIALLTV
jgi:hypothetical protein